MSSNIVLVLLMLLSILMICFPEKVTYIHVERPILTYYNKKFARYTNLTSKRYSRANPIYYVNFNFEIIYPLDEDNQMDIYFYQLLTNVYKISFIEFHYDFCTFLEKDIFFAPAMRQGPLKGRCPYPPGIYNLSNMTVDPAVIPKNFPFTHGRILANLTKISTKEWLGEGYIDMKIAQIDKKKAKF